MHNQKRDKVLGLFIGIAMGGAALLTGVGCDLVTKAPRPEPSSVYVRNLSGGSLRWVTLTEARTKRGQSVRLGMMSPVPAGTMQGLGRPTDPPPLPSWVEVRWADAFGQEHSRQVSLVEVLKKATGSPNEALVFRIYARGNLEAVLELETP